MVTVKHPNDALATLRKSQASFDIVMTDYHMPDMNGLELQEQVQEEFKLPVISGCPLNFTSFSFLFLSFWL